MHVPRIAPTRGRRIAAVVAIGALLSMGLTSPAGAASGAATPKKNTVALCGQAAPGKARCLSLRRTDLTAHRGLVPAVTVAGYGPTDLQSAYAIPANGGAGQTVAIVDAFDDPNAEADLAVYRAQFGLPPCTTANGCFSKVDQRGGTNYPPPDAGWAGEISLDVDMVSAVAPLAHILLVESDDNFLNNLGAAVDEAVALGAKYVSNSYGGSEDPSDPTDGDPHYDHPGVAVVASSGDSGFGPQYPAAAPGVTSVGGTSLVQDGSARGWSETVWNNSFGAPGSGCSAFEPKPAWQTDSGCSNRTIADVSAVADPVTGVAVYDTFGNGGWSVFGGTSASSPIIASVYADAGTPVAGTTPASYPYANPGALNDVTVGNDGSCSPSYLCTAGPGYDGPTGLGTPNGLTAFTTGPHGHVSGTVTDSVTHAGIAGASVTVGDAHGSTDSSGHYDVNVPVGTYDETVAAFGYATQTIHNVAVTDGGTTTEDFAMVAVASSVVSGTVHDGSGHNWPLYAKITIDGVPGGPIFTDPYTGHYSVTLPDSATYTMHVTAAYTGYQAVTQDVNLGTSDTVADVAVPVDAASCDAPGYAVGLSGTSQTFDGTTTPAGWTVQNNTAVGGWAFNDPHPRGNLTGGTGGFAIIDSDNLGIGNTEDTYMISPVTDMSGFTAPDVAFDTDYHDLGSVAQVDMSVDGGSTWSNIWDHSGSDFRGPAHVDIPVPQAAGKSSVQVRFHYTGTWAWWWEVDNVFLGSRTCNPSIPGGLVVGTVSDANTGNGIVGATVTSVDAPSDNATTVATPDDPNLGDGFYWMFSTLTGSHSFTAARSHYVSQSKSLTVAGNAANKLTFSLKAGRITITPGAISKTVSWQGTASQTLTIKNTGGATATVQLSELPGATVPLVGGGAPVQRINGKFSPLSLHGVTSTTPVKPSVTPADAPWTAIADYPVNIQDNSVVTVGGKVYSAYGFTGSADTAALYVYDPDTGSWTALAPASGTREKPAMVSIGGKIYAAGGWDSTGNPTSKLEIYDPATDSWTTGATNPLPYAGSGTAVLGGKMYIVGGCTAVSCGKTDVNVYDPATDSWSQVAPYPVAVSWESCGAISGILYCAGGVNDSSTLTATYAYDPGSDSWSPEASMPMDMWGSGYVAAEGKLLVSGGVTNNNSTITNQGFSFDPGANAWTALPNSNNTVYRGGSACGFYKVGGSPGGLFATPLTSSEVLPGNVDCGENTDVSWLSENKTTVTLAAGGSTTVKVTVNANVPDITQPGTYNASLSVGTNTPYSVPSVSVSMKVNPPKTWGKISGVVSGPNGPIAGATIQINTWATHYTLKTDKNGYYQLWLDVRNNPLQVICAKDGFQPQVKTVRIAKGVNKIVNFNLLKS